MTTNLLPQPTVGNDRPENDEHLALEAPTARADTDPAGVADPPTDDPAIDERKWYPPPGTPCM